MYNPVLEAAREAAHADVLRAREYIDAYHWRAVRDGGEGFPSNGQQKADNEVALAAKNVAERTEELAAVLAQNESVIKRIEMAQANLATAREQLAEAELKRDRMQGDGYACLDQKHVVTDFERGRQAGLDYLAGQRAAGKRI